jgi:hypothetical protein
MSGNASLQEVLNQLQSALSSLTHAAPEIINARRRAVADCLNTIAQLAGLKPVALGGVPLEDDDTITTVGEIPT